MCVCVCACVCVCVIVYYKDIDPNKLHLQKQQKKKKQDKVNNHHHHHHVAPPARISLTVSRHFSLSLIASGRSSGLQPVSSHSC